MSSDTSLVAWLDADSGKAVAPLSLSPDRFDATHFHHFVVHSAIDSAWANIWRWSAMIPHAAVSDYAANVARLDPVAVVESLTDDWDGEGALAPTEAILATVKRVLHAFEGIVPEPDVTANENGTVTIEWESGVNYASVEIGATTFAFMMRANGGRTRFIGGDASRLDATTALEIESAMFPELATPTPTVGTYAS